MNEKEKLYDTLLQLGTALREKRAHVYGVGWELHKEKVEAVCEADKQYMDLPLTEEQKEVIERMLEKRMEANECELTLTYAAGILDGIMYLRNAGFLDMYVVDEEEKTARRRPVRIGRQNPQYYEVLDGLEPGERVIVSGYENYGSNDVLILNK